MRGEERNWGERGGKYMGALMLEKRTDCVWLGVYCTREEGYWNVYHGKKKKITYVQHRIQRQIIESILLYPLRLEWPHSQSVSRKEYDGYS